MARYYSQHGEDIVIDKMFMNQSNGFFIEVGCIEGRRFSNTLTLEERGWSGICIEAHNDYIESLKKNRPGSTVIHSAVGAKDRDEVIFYANNRGSLSSLDKSQENYFKEEHGKYFGGFTEQKVKLRTLKSIINEYNVEKIDLLSVDVEGSEMEVLQGLDFKLIRPRVIVSECDSKKQEDDLDGFLESIGYKKSIRVANNRFYVLEAVLHESVAFQEIKGTVIHTKHPLDNNGDREVAVCINTFPAAESNRVGWLKNISSYLSSGNLIGTPRSGKSLVGDGSRRVFVSTVYRETKNNTMSGFLLKLDWPEARVLNKAPIPATGKGENMWGGRGGNRGGRGIFYHDDKIYLATAVSIRVYNKDLELIKEIHNPKIAGIHEIFVDETGIWVTSTIHDLIIKINEQGDTLYEWHGSEDAILQKKFNFNSRKLNFDLDFEGDFEANFNEYSGEERLHINSVQILNQKIYCFANKLGALFKIGDGETEVIYHDDGLIGAHNAYITKDYKLLINDTKDQNIIVINLNEKKLEKIINTKIYKSKKASQFTRAGWQRGMSPVEKDLYLIGTSPVTVFEVDVRTGKLGKSMQLSQDIKHCVHGLLVLNEVNG